VAATISRRVRDEHRLHQPSAATPLLDHFPPPLSAERRWESFHSSWATKLADALTERWLPPNYIAEEHARLGPSVESDVATFERERSASRPEEGGGVQGRLLIDSEGCR
jgi:hypothetical protein